MLDSKIDELCDEVALLLTCSLDCFGANMKYPATDANVNNAESKKREVNGFIPKERCVKR